MRFMKIQKIAFQSIMKNRMRSILTSLGIIIGVCSVIVMVAVGQGSSLAIEQQINGLGTNLLMVFPSHRQMGGVSQGAGSKNNLTSKDVDKIREQAQYVQYVSASVRSSGQIIGGVGNWNTSIEGVDPDFLDIKSWEMAEGSFFTAKDVKSKKKVCVLGKTVADELFPDMSVIGQKVRIRNTPFIVLGVLAEKGQTNMGDQDDTILAPSSTVQYRLKGSDKLNMIYVSATSAEEMELAEEEVDNIIRASHKTDEGDDSDVIIRSQTEITEMATATSDTLTLLLGAIAGVSLLVGGIGIMNIMLVSVTERTREIGIRLSIGARSRDVLAQFLSEAFTLSVSGGVIGIIISMIICYILNRFTAIPTSINPMVVGLSFLFSGAVGVFFGYYPARKAANLNPIDALRYE